VLLTSKQGQHHSVCYFSFSPGLNTLSISQSEVTQIILSTAHPAKFSEAVTRALGEYPEFHFEKDVLPDDFKGLLKKERKVIDVDSPTVEAVKKVIDDNELRNAKNIAVGV
jgi:threonine synthase